jgi:hypothetical protein
MNATEARAANFVFIQNLVLCVSTLDACMNYETGALAIPKWWNILRISAISVISIACVACSDSLPSVPAHWSRTVQVEGQTEPVPESWVSTPEGKLAHSIKIPNPLPKDSGYRKGMTGKEYFEHLCKTEAGEFNYRPVDTVEGFFFARPPMRPSDDALKDRFLLEAPEIERTYQLLRATPEERAQTFVNPPWRLYSFVEEPDGKSGLEGGYLRMSGYRQDHSLMKVEVVSKLVSRFGMIWRGIKRPNDREFAIAGSEWIVFDLTTKEVVALQRNFAFSGFVRNVPGGIYWLNALSCPNVPPVDNLPSKFYVFVSTSLRPIAKDQK